MKRFPVLPLVLVMVLLLFLPLVLNGAQGATPQFLLGTAFTYQGYLTGDGRPLDGTCDFQFGLWDALTAGNQVGATVTKLAIPVGQGRFSVQLDFGNVFDGTALWLEVAVRCGDPDYTTLSPRQELTEAPYAGYALSTGALQGRPVGNVGPGTGQVLKWDGAAWLPQADDDTLYSAGPGLILTATVFSVDTTYLQRRVTGACGPGFCIRQVDADGSVICEADDDTLYDAGMGLILSGTTFVPDPTYLQRRVAPCGASYAIQSVNQDGSVVCQLVDNTTYSAGTGLYLAGTTFGITTTYRLPQTCTNSQVTKWNGSSWTCAADDNTTYSAGTGLDLAGTTFSLLATYQLPQSCTDGQVTKWSGAVWTCAADDNTTYSAGTGLNLAGTTFSLLATYQLPQDCTSSQIARWDGTAWTCSSDVGVTDHGALTGLGDDDHPQYFYLSQNETVTGVPHFDGGASGVVPPFYVDSDFVITNLNADQLDGYHAGNASGEIPISNGILNTSLNSEQLQGYVPGNASGEIPLNNGNLNAGLNADLLDGFHASSFLPFTHTHWGESWVGTGTGLQLSGGTTGLAALGSTQGVYAEGGAYGIWATGTSRGVYGTTGAAGGAGVYGRNAASSGYGVYGLGASTGVYGQGTTYGVYGRNTGDTGYAVYGHGVNRGVYGFGYTYGVIGEGSIGVYGISYSAYGVQGTGQYGVYGTSNYFGVYGRSTAGGYFGVYGLNVNGYGGYFENATSTHRALVAYNNAGTNSPGLEVYGTSYFWGAKTGYVAEICLAEEPLEQGDVVVVVGSAPAVQGTIPVMRVQRAATSYATGVVGIVDVRQQIDTNQVAEMPLTLGPDERPRVLDRNGQATSATLIHYAGGKIDRGSYLRRSPPESPGACAGDERRGPPQADTFRSWERQRGAAPAVGRTRREGGSGHG